MATSLEKFFLAKVKMMPPVEMDLTQQMTKKNDPKKVLPPGSAQSALANPLNKNTDYKNSPLKSAQHALPPTVPQPTGKKDNTTGF